MSLALRAFFFSHIIPRENPEGKTLLLGIINRLYNEIY